jgi:hypothetical protein
MKLSWLTVLKTIDSQLFQNSNGLFSKRKKKKESSSIEVMMNENGGSIPTDSEEWTLHLLPFYIDDYFYVITNPITTKNYSVKVIFDVTSI